MSDRLTTLRAYSAEKHYDMDRETGPEPKVIEPLKYDAKLQDPNDKDGNARVTIGGFDLFTIRYTGDAVFACPLERAQMIAHRMNMAARKKSTMLFEVRGGDDGSYVVSMTDHMGHNDHKLITVFRQDVDGYKRHGLSHMGPRYKAFAETLDERMLGLYWRDLASDVHAVFCNGQPPRALVRTFCGKVLDIIYERARQRQPDGMLAPDVLRQVVSGLGSDEKMHMRMITTLVPFDYIPAARVNKR